jgi:hypothetical protein
MFYPKNLKKFQKVSPKKLKFDDFHIKVPPKCKEAI